MTARAAEDPRPGVATTRHHTHLRTSLLPFFRSGGFAIGPVLLGALLVTVDASTFLAAQHPGSISQVVASGAASVDARLKVPPKRKSPAEERC